MVCAERYSCEDTSTEKNQYGEGCSYFNTDRSFGQYYYRSGSVPPFECTRSSKFASAIEHELASVMTLCRRKDECSEPLGNNVSVGIYTRPRALTPHAPIIHHYVSINSIFETCTNHVVSQQMCAVSAVAAKAMTVCTDTCLYQICAHSHHST